MQRYITISRPSLHVFARLFAYYLQRSFTSRRLRRIATYALVQILCLVHPQGQRANAISGRTRRFRNEGYLPLGRVLTHEQCVEICRYLEDKTMHDTRGTGNNFVFSKRPLDTKIGDYPPETVVGCPHVMDVVNRTEFLKLAIEYLGFTPTILNVSLRWSFPTIGAADQVQRFHRDSETGSFKILAYVTDVDLTSGPHEYVTASHRDRMPLRLRSYSDEEIVRKYRKIETITGVAGTAFAVDTKGIHKGAPPMTRPRLILGIHYALLPCPLYDYVPVQHRIAERFDRYVNRLIVRCPDSR